jgi:hypothetical protein
MPRTYGCREAHGKESNGLPEEDEMDVPRPWFSGPPTLAAHVGVHLFGVTSRAATGVTVPAYRRHEEGAMIKQLDDVPDGVIGLEASGEVTADDYRDVTVPALTAASERGGIRLLYVIHDHTRFSVGAAFADAKLGLTHLKGWERVAVVSDADWLENSIKAFGWMMPGEVKMFDDDEVDEAKAWLTQSSD